MDALAFATAVVVLITSVITLILSIKNRRRVEQVHVLVNSQMTGMVKRVDQLADALDQAGMDVPPPNEHTSEEGN